MKSTCTLNLKKRGCSTSVGTSQLPVGLNWLLYWSTGAESEQIPIQVVSGNYFSALGASAALGRTFAPDEDEKPTPVVVLSHGFWERSLGRDANIVGKDELLTLVSEARKSFIEADDAKAESRREAERSAA